MLEMFETSERLKSIFVAGVAGGIGGALAELAKDRGLVVIGSVGSAEREAYARAAEVDHIVNYRQEDVIARILALTDGRGVDAAFDHIVGPRFATLFNSLADFGTLVFYNVHNQPPDADVFEEMSRLSTKSLALRCQHSHIRPSPRQASADDANAHQSLGPASNQSPCGPSPTTVGSLKGSDTSRARISVGKNCPLPLVVAGSGAYDDGFEN